MRVALRRLFRLANPPGKPTRPAARPRGLNRRFKIMMRHTWLIVTAIVMLCGGVGAVGYLLANQPTELTIAVGPPNSEDTRIVHLIAAHLARDEEHNTGTSINLTFDSGHRHFISCLPNNESLAFEDLDLSSLPNYDHLLRSDIWFSQAMLFGGNERLLRIARDAGVAVSLDLNWDPCWGRAPAERLKTRKDAVRAVLPYVNLAHGNVRELNEFADSSNLETSLGRLEEWGVEAIVVHLGADGAGFYRNGEYFTEPAVPAERHINATGTGDVLSVCMILLHGNKTLSIAEKLQFANTIVSEFIAGRRELIPPISGREPP